MRASFKKICSKQSGESIVMITGALGILLVLLTLVLEVTHFYNTKAKVQSLADQIASYAAQALPNPVLSCKRAFDAYGVLKNDFVSDQPHFDEASIFSVWFDYYQEAGADPISSSWVSDRADCESIPNIKPPLDSLHLRLSVPAEPATFRIFKFGNDASWSDYSSTADATARLTATDVVLVIENSNSVVSELSEENTAERGEAFAAALPDGHPFEAWKDIFIGYKNNADASPAANYREEPEEDENSLVPRELSVAQQRLRQCFGKVHYDIKRAALQIFDLLSSSSSFRVGVVHTLSPGGEFNLPSIGISDTSYQEIYTAQTSLNSQGLFNSAPQPYYGGVDNPESRCAALVVAADSDEDDQKYYVKMPAHPFEDAFPGITHEGGDGVGKWTLPSTDMNDAAAPTQFKSSEMQFLPRDLIWIANAGVAGAYTQLEPKFDFTPMQAAILRARDMLISAKKRADDRPVRKRVVLVFTDGFENPLTNFNQSDLGFDSVFKRAQQSLSGLASATPEALSRVSGTPTASDTLPVVSNYCAPASLDGLAADKNPIFNDTSVIAYLPEHNSEGMKLGIMYVRDRATFTKHDAAFNRLAHVPGHDIESDGTGADSTRVDSFRNYCNTPWTYSRGRFMIEMSTGSAEVLSAPALVARSLMDPQVGDN